MAEELNPRDELNQLLVENGQREEEIHRLGGCSDAILSQLRLQAFIDTVIEELGAEEMFALRVERQKAEAQIALLKQAQRSRIAVPGMGN